MTTFWGGECSAELSKALSACEFNDVNKLALSLKGMKFVDDLTKYYFHYLFDKCIKIDDHLRFELLLLFIVERTKMSIDDVADSYNLMIRTMKFKNNKCFEYLLSVSFDIDRYLHLPKGPRRLLQMACIDNMEEAVGLLLKYGADVNCVDLLGDNVMHKLIRWYDNVFVIKSHPQRIMQMLLMVGANAFCKNNKGEMPGEYEGMYGVYGSSVIGKTARSHAENCY